MAVNPNVSVRLDPTLAALIEEEARARKLPKSEFLRQLITAALTETKTEDLTAEIMALRENVRRVRDDVAKLAVLILTGDRGRPPMSVAEAKAVVTQLFASEAGGG